MMSTDLKVFKQVLDMKLSVAKKNGPGTSAFDAADKKKAKALLIKFTKKPIRISQGYNY